MFLYFMRHAEAEEARPGLTDFDRPLTEKGLRRSKEAGKALAAMKIELARIFTSPLVRARQTAESVAAELNVPVETAKILGTHFGLQDLQSLCKEFNDQESIMLVGHEPDFSLVIGELIGGGAVEMKKGSIACVYTVNISRGGNTLLWLLNGKQLSLIAK